LNRQSVHRPMSDWW